jgi:hypothetical protein
LPNKNQVEFDRTSLTSVIAHVASALEPVQCEF